MRPPSARKPTRDRPRPISIGLASQRRYPRAPKATAARTLSASSGAPSTRTGRPGWARSAWVAALRPVSTARWVPTMSTSGERVASRDMSEAASPTTSTRPTKGSATRREATSSRTRRRSSYTQTVAPLTGPRVLSSITPCSSLPPAGIRPGPEPTGEHPAGAARVGAPVGGTTSALVAARTRLSAPEPTRPGATLIDTIGLRQPPSPPGVRAASEGNRTKSCDLRVFDHAGPRAPAPMQPDRPLRLHEPWRRHGRHSQAPDAGRRGLGLAAPRRLPWREHLAVLPPRR